MVIKDCQNFDGPLMLNKIVNKSEGNCALTGH